MRLQFLKDAEVEKVISVFISIDCYGRVINNINILHSTWKNSLPSSTRIQVPDHHQSKQWSS